jgi:hypothetical protein
MAKLLDVDVFVLGHQPQPNGWSQVGPTLSSCFLITTTAACPDRRPRATGDFWPDRAACRCPRVCGPDTSHEIRAFGLPPSSPMLRAGLRLAEGAGHRMGGCFAPAHSAVLRMTRRRHGPRHD